MEVYFALNRTNGKAYVGWTKNTAPVRFKDHCKDARRGSPFYFHQAIRKHGANAFDVLTVWKGDDAEEMKQVEKNYIAGMRTNDRCRGYNLTAGGDGTVGHSHTPEYKKWASESRLGVPQPLTRGAAHWVNRTGSNPFRDQHHSEESKTRMSQQRKGKRTSPATEIKPDHHLSPKTEIGPGWLESRLAKDPDFLKKRGEAISAGKRRKAEAAAC
jgi:group I intron endonuclease